MFGQCPFCLAPLFQNEGAATEQRHCPQCKQSLSTPPLPQAGRPLAQPVPEAIQASRPPDAPLGPVRFEPVPEYASSMRIMVTLQCVEDVKRRERDKILYKEVTWRTTYRTLDIPVARPIAGSVQLPLICPCCEKKVTLRVHSRAVVQNTLLRWQCAWGLLALLGGLTLLFWLEHTPFYLASAAVPALIGVSLLDKCFWLLMNRPSGFDSLGDSVEIVEDELRKEDSQGPSSGREHNILLLSRLDRIDHDTPRESG
jgi:hypothetical protein